MPPVAPNFGAGQRKVMPSGSTAKHPNRRSILFAAFATIVNIVAALCQ